MSSKEQYTLSGRLLISDPNENELKFTKDFGSLEYLSKAESTKSVRIFGICGEDSNHRKRFMKGLLGEEFVQDSSSSLPCVHFAFRKSSTNDDYLLFLDIDNELWVNNSKLFYIFLFLCYRVYFSFALPTNERPSWLVKKLLECGEEVFTVYNSLPSMTFLHEDLEELEYHRIVSILEQQTKKSFVENVMLPTLLKGRGSAMKSEEEDGEEDSEDESPEKIQTEKFFNMFDNTSYYPLVDTPKELRKRIISRIRGDLFGSTFESKPSEKQSDRRKIENVFTLDSLMTLLKDLVQLNNLGGMTNQNFVKIMKLKKTIGKSMTEVTQKITNFEKILEVRKLKETEKLEKKINALDVKEELDRIRERLEKTEAEQADNNNKLINNFDERFKGVYKKINELEKKIGKGKPVSKGSSIGQEEEEEEEQQQHKEDKLLEEKIMSILERKNMKPSPHQQTEEGGGGGGEREELRDDVAQQGKPEEEEEREVGVLQKRIQEEVSQQVEDLKTEMKELQEKMERQKTEEAEEEKEEKLKKLEEQVQTELKDLETKLEEKREQQMKTLLSPSSNPDFQDTLDSLEEKIQKRVAHQLERTHIEQTSLAEQVEKRVDSLQQQNELTIEQAIDTAQTKFGNQVSQEVGQAREEIKDEVELLKAELREQQLTAQKSVNSTLTDFEGQIAELNETSKMRQLNLERHYKDEFQKVNLSFDTFEKRMATVIQQQCKVYLKNSFLELRKGLERQIEQKLQIQREQQMNEWKTLKDLVLKELGAQINKEFLKIEEQRRLSKEEFDIIINEMIRHEGNMEKFRKKIVSTNKVFKSKLLGEVDYVLQEFKKRVIVGSLDKAMGVRVDTMEGKVRSIKKFIDGLKRVGIVGVGTAPSFKYTKSKFYLQNLVEKNYQKMITSKHGIHTKIKGEENLMKRKDELDLEENRSTNIEEEEGERISNNKKQEEEEDESLLKLAKVMEKKDMMDRKKKKRRNDLGSDKTLSLNEERDGEGVVAISSTKDNGGGIVQGDFNNSSLLDQIQTISNGSK